VRVLLDHGADVDVRDCNGATPLILGCREAVQPCIVRLLLDHGAHVNAQDEFGDSPLARTVYRDDASLETIRLLLHRGAGVNVQNWDCDTTLYTFVQSHGCTEHPNCLKDREILRLLMAYGGNPNLPNKQGETALRCAQQYERPDLIALMSHVPDHQ
jgi:ankyrin repeat protein